MHSFVIYVTIETIIKNTKQGIVTNNFKIEIQLNGLLEEF